MGSQLFLGFLKFILGISIIAITTVGAYQLGHQITTFKTEPIIVCWFFGLVLECCAVFLCYVAYKIGDSILN